MLDFPDKRFLSHCTTPDNDMVELIDVGIAHVTPDFSWRDPIGLSSTL
jgi:hypothetical protein